MQGHVCPISPYDAHIAVVDHDNGAVPCKLERLQNASERYVRAAGKTKGARGVFTEVVIAEGAQILPQFIFEVVS